MSGKSLVKRIKDAVPVAGIVVTVAGGFWLLHNMASSSVLEWNKTAHSHFPNYSSVSRVERAENHEAGSRNPSDNGYTGNPNNEYTGVDTNLEK
ncbi:MAG: hypothetical protein V1740_04560 [Candidatus Woesearchaeota archaeon]